jgi:hypothetical protein
LGYSAFGASESAAPAAGGEKIDRVSSLITPAQDLWRTWNYPDGAWNANPWTEAEGSSGSGSVTIDPTVHRWGNGFVIPTAATLQTVLLYHTPNTTPPGSYDLYFDLWKTPLSDGLASDPSATRIFRTNYTIDTTPNKVYYKAITAFDTAALSANDLLMLYFTTPDANGNGNQQRFNLTIKYE